MRDFFRASIARGQGRANPLFPTKKMPRWKRWFFSFSLFATPLAIVFLAQAFFSQPRFLITSTEISGAVSLDQNLLQSEIDKELQGKIGLIFPKNNYLFVNRDRLTENLKTNFPINDVHLEVIDNVFHVAIQEDVTMVIVRSNENWFLVGLDGVILRTLSADEATDLPNNPPQIILGENIPIDSKDPVLSTSLLTSLADLDTGLRDMGLTPMHYALETRKDTWVSLTIKEKPYVVYIELEKPITEQLKIFSSILSQQEEIPNMTYMDLRFGNRVYMK